MHYVHRPEVPQEPADEREVNPTEAPMRSAEGLPQRLQNFPPGAGCSGSEHPSRSRQSPVCAHDAGQTPHFARECF